MSTVLNLIDRLAADSVLADSLDLALQQGLFDRLDRPLSASQLAREMAWHAEPVGHLLELFWSFDLLSRERDGDDYRYSTPAETHSYLSKRGDRYTGDAVRYRLQTVRGFGQQLNTMLTQPLPGFSEQLPHDAAWADAANTQIAQEQRALTADTACAIAAGVPQFLRRARLLDMGGGPGLVSIALATRYPLIEGVVQDFTADRRRCPAAH